jgi:hypothetical protein
MSDQPSTQSSVRETITRADLIAITDAASEGCVESTRAKMRAVAETTQAVAVGWFHCDGERCPASQAQRRNQRFMEAFDRAMAARYGREVGKPAGFGPAFEPFVVEVRDVA